jgi:uncharacterized membrane protein
VERVARARAPASSHRGIKDPSLAILPVVVVPTTQDTMAAKRIPTQFIVSAFTREDGVDQVEKDIMDAEWESKTVLCTNMAVVKKDIAGKVQVKEMGNPNALKGKPVGHLVGGFALLLLGDEGVKAGAAKRGSISSYGVSHVEGMDKDRLAKVADALPPGSSACIVVFDEVFVDCQDGKEFLTKYKASTDGSFDDMATQISESLSAGNNISYHFVIDENGVTETRKIAGADAANVQEILLKPGGVMLFDETDVRASGTVVQRTKVITPELYTSTRTAMRQSTVEYETRTLIDDIMETEAGVMHVEKDE